MSAAPCCPQACVYSASHPAAASWSQDPGLDHAVPLEGQRADTAAPLLQSCRGRCGNLAPVSLLSTSPGELPEPLARGSAPPGSIPPSHWARAGRAVQWDEALVRGGAAIFGPLGPCTGLWPPEVGGRWAGLRRLRSPASPPRAPLRTHDAAVPDLGGVQSRGRETLPRRPYEGKSPRGRCLCPGSGCLPCGPRGLRSFSSPGRRCWA